MTSTIDKPKKAIILYDSMSVGGSADRLIDAIGKNLAEAGAYVEEFDLVLLGAPIYYLLVASKLSGALAQTNLRATLKGKKVALFVICGSPEPMAHFLYLPQLKMNLDNPVILAEKAFSPAETSDPKAIAEFTQNILDAYGKAN